MLIKQVTVLDCIQGINNRKIKVTLVLTTTTIDSVLIFCGAMRVNDKLKHSLHYLVLWRKKPKLNVVSCICILFSILSQFLEDSFSCTDIHVQVLEFTAHIALHLFQSGSRRTLLEYFKSQGRDITDSWTLAAPVYPHWSSRKKLFFKEQVLYIEVER